MSSTSATTSAITKASASKILMVADSMGQSAKYKGFAEQCMAEYDLDGWTVPDLINPDDISAVMKSGNLKR